MCSQAPGAEPKVKCLLSEGEELEVLDDHFSIPVCYVMVSFGVIQPFSLVHGVRMARWISCTDLDHSLSPRHSTH